MHKIKILMVRPRHDWAENISQTLIEDVIVDVIDFKDPVRYSKIDTIGKHINYTANNNLDYYTDILINYINLSEYNIVLISQKLDMFSDLCAEICRQKNIRYIYNEAFFEDNIIFDSNGMQYTPNSDIDKYSYSNYDIITPHKFETREIQQAGNIPDSENALVIFQQVPHDKSLMYNADRELLCNPKESYESWVRDLCIKHDGDVFIKKHPKYRYEIEYLPDNVVYVDASCEQFLCLTDAEYAAFSSTVIYEGAIKGCRFETGGLHLMRGVDTTKYTDVMNRHNFLWGAYTISTKSRSRLLNRINSSTDKWYNELCKEL